MQKQIEGGTGTDLPDTLANFSDIDLENTEELKHSQEMDIDENDGSNDVTNAKDVTNGICFFAK